MNILIVEDNLADFELIDLRLKRVGNYQTSNAKTLEEALDMLQNHKFKMILLDLGLPDSQGERTFDKIIEKFNNIPIVLMTGLNDQELGLSLIKKGAQDFLLKDEITSFNLRKSIGYASNRFETQKALKESEEKLKHSNQTKDKFFSILAHDLRNPIGSFVVTTDYLSTCLEEDDLDDVKVLISEMNKSSKKTLELLENLLVWAKTQNGQIGCSPQIIDLSLTIDSVISLVKTKKNIGDINFISNIPNKTMIFADSNMLHTILRNLITNAVKFSNETGNIYIDFVEKSSEFVISVKDEGIGLSEKDINRLFKLDINTQSIGKSDLKGSGLGLLLVQEFVELHDGRVWVESQEDKGSTFFFTISKTIS